MAKWGYEVLSAPDGSAAWEELQKPDAPDLLVLDWEMPGMDGIDVCRRVRAAEGDHPRYIILLTARSDTADLVAGLDAGANDYVGKPSSPPNCGRASMWVVASSSYTINFLLLDAPSSIWPAPIL